MYVPHISRTRRGPRTLLLYPLVVLRPSFVDGHVRLSLYVRRHVRTTRHGSPKIRHLLFVVTDAIT